MKKAICLVLAFIITATLYGCSNNNGKNVSNESESETASTATVITTKGSEATETTKKETTRETNDSATVSTIDPETSSSTEPSSITSEEDIYMRLDAGEIIAWTSGDSLEIDYQSEGEEIIEYFITDEDNSGDFVEYTLKVNNAIATSEEASASSQCYIAKVSGHYVFLIGVSNEGSTWWTDVYTYFDAKVVYLGNVRYTSPNPERDSHLWIDSNGILCNRHTSGQSGIVDYVQRHMIAYDRNNWSNGAIFLFEVPPAELIAMGYYVTAKASVPVFINRYGDSIEWTINPSDEVIFVATDVLEFVYVEKADHSQTGWIRIDYYEDTCLVSDGTMTYIYDVFSGIPVGG